MKKSDIFGLASIVGTAVVGAVCAIGIPKIAPCSTKYVLGITGFFTGIAFWVIGGLIWVNVIEPKLDERKSKKESLFQLGGSR